MIDGLEIKNVKSFLGNEGYGYNASLYFKGKKVALAIDDANGGCVTYWWEKGTDSAQAEIEAKVKALPPEVYNGMELSKDLDWIVSDLVDAYENAKRLNRKRKTHVLFRTDKGEFQIKHYGDPEAAKKYVMNKYPEAVFI